MRGAQLARQWKILRLLESRKQGISVAEISAQLESPTRTIYRDLEAIQEAGFPVYSEREDRNSYWRMMDGFQASLPLPLTATELMSLHMSRDILKIFEGTVFQENIESLFAKVKACLSHEMLRYLDNISGGIRVSFGPSKDYGVLREMVAQLSDATAKKRQVQILYSALSTGKKTLRRVDPYQVWAMNGAFYLIGKCHLRAAVRTFAMDRIKKLAVLDEAFLFPEDFSMDDYLQTAFRVMTGRPEVVKVWFRSSAAQVVKERIWHPTQEIREQEDGNVVITLEVPINYEVTSWILGFGSAAEVLAPAHLREQIEQELGSSLTRYRSKASTEKGTAVEGEVFSHLS
jgi:predicted DNA-binding transcriptional regulator YafY